MAIPTFLKRKSTYIVLILVLAGAGWLWYGKSQSGKTTYETVAVAKQDLKQTVEVTGEIKPAERIDLAFRNSGKISAVNVKVGDTVKVGDILAELDAQDAHFAVQNAKAALSIAQANLDAKIAGETKQSIRVSETQVEQAQASLEKALNDLDSIRKTSADAVTVAQISFETAQNSLTNADAIASQTTQNAYDTSRSTLLSALGPLQTGLTDGDQIIGVDNSAANSYYSSLLGILDLGSMDRAKSSYAAAKSAKAVAETAVKGLTASSSKEAILAAADLVQNAVTLVQAYLSDVQKVLAASLTSSYFTTTDLTAKKTTIDADRTSVSSQKTIVEGAVQTIKNSELAKTQTVQQLQDAVRTAQVAWDTAKTNADVQVKSAQTNVTVQQAAVDAAKASLDQKKAGPRAVDLASLRATVMQAQVNYEKAMNDLEDVQILAPVDGIVSEVLPDVGEQIVMNTTAVRMVGTSSYDIEANVPETDIAKISVGQTAEITLDAYGDEVKFVGSVTAKDPAETMVQDAVYYKIRVQIDPQGKEVKPKMTANVIVTTAEVKNAMIIPLRTIKTANGGTKTVRILLDGKPQDKTITIGIKGDEGKVEVKSGLSEGDQVIASEKTGS
ncbi:efflux RND transporter periplasmic adaptor subunit [Candidatus Uhrbacteria bacterium]|nr:efflux RND transporter periplasmic adaptor subunit [Candidatus Uhrbacteria bacterium]